MPEEFCNPLRIASNRKYWQRGQTKGRNRERQRHIGRTATEKDRPIENIVLSTTATIIIRIKFKAPGLQNSRPPSS